MGFLQPTRAEKEAIAAKANELERKKKEENKRKTAERKRERENAKARIAVIEEEIKRKRLNTVENSKLDERVTSKLIAYLDSPPYFGNSAFNDKDYVKELCGDGSRVWEKADKVWGTKKIANLVLLLKSQIWFPLGLHEDWLEDLLKLATARADDESASAEARSNVKWENDHSKIAAENEAKDSTAHLSIYKRAELRDEHERKKRLTLASSLDTTDERRACLDLGFTEEAIDASASWFDLGPFGPNAISVAARLLRHVSIEKKGVRYEYNLPREVYMDDDRYQPYIDKFVKELVARLNARATAGQS